MKKDKKTNRFSSFLRGFAIAIGFAAVFGLGVGVGQGRVALDNRPLAKNSSLPEDLDYDTIEYTYDTLKANYDGELDKEKIIDGLKAGLAEAAGDPYTQYLNKSETEEFKNDLNGTFTGIGAQLIRRDDVIIIEVPLAGYPAEKAGLKAKDVIIEIDGKNALELSVNEAVKLIRGPENTKVKLKVVRDKKQELEFEITRAKISIPNVEYDILEGNIGYIKISKFGDDTVRLTTEAANKFKQAGVKGVILDMRNDPGGLLDASISVSSLWLPKGKLILQEKRGEAVIQTYTSNGSAILQGVPTVVMINGGSASASEIVAGALKDNGAATIIGEKSFGKGSVQQLAPLKGGGVLKVTIARWFTPAGKNIDKEGISPDQEVKRSDEDLAAGRDPQKDAAINFLKK